MRIRLYDKILHLAQKLLLKEEEKKDFFFFGKLVLPNTQKMRQLFHSHHIILKLMAPAFQNSLKLKQDLLNSGRKVYVNLESYD